jgi:hypothetical protein
MLVAVDEEGKGVRAGYLFAQSVKLSDQLNLIVKLIANLVASFSPFSSPFHLN